MKIEATDAEKNTIRAALSAHSDKVYGAMAQARKEKDEDHLVTLRAEWANIRAAMRVL